MRSQRRQGDLIFNKRGIFMNDEEFHEVYQKNHKLIYHAVLIRTNNRDLAEDICQQTFLKYFEYSDTVEKGSETGWLLKVAKNLSIDHDRRNKHLLLDEQQMNDESLEPCYELDIAKEVSRKDFLRQIMYQLEERNKDWYDAVMEVCVLNQPEKDVAKRMGISIELLRTRIYRGRQFLKKIFGEDYENLK